jgi:hypothetical protein
VFTDPLPSNDKGGIHITDLWEGFMKCAVEMGSGGMIYIPSFIKIDSGIQNFWGGDIQAHRYSGAQTEWRSHKPTFIFSK